MTTNIQAPLFGQPLSKPRRSRPGADPRVKRLVDAADVIVPGLMMSYGKQASAAKRLLNARFEPDVILSCLRFLLTDAWFTDRMIPVDLGIVGQRIGAWVKAGSPATCRESARPSGYAAEKKAAASEYNDRWAAKREQRMRDEEMNNE